MPETKYYQQPSWEEQEKRARRTDAMARVQRQTLARGQAPQGVDPKRKAAAAARKKKLQDEAVARGKARLPQSIAEGKVRAQKKQAKVAKKKARSDKKQARKDYTKAWIASRDKKSAAKRKEQKDYTKSWIADRDEKISERRKQRALKKTIKGEEKAKQKSIRAAEKAEKKKQFALKMGKWSEQKKKDWKPFSSIDRKVDKEVEKYKAMYGPGSAYALNADKEATEGKKEELKKLEKRLASSQYLPSISEEDALGMSDQQKQYYTNISTVRQSTASDLVSEINTLRTELGMEPLAPPTSGGKGGGSNGGPQFTDPNQQVTWDALQKVYASGDTTAIAALDSALSTFKTDSSGVKTAGTDTPPVIDDPAKWGQLRKGRWADLYIRKNSKALSGEQKIALKKWARGSGEWPESLDKAILTQP